MRCVEFSSTQLGAATLEETFLTVAEIAELLKVNQQTVRNWIDAGSLGAVRIGWRRVRVRESELERFINSGGDVQSAGEANEEGVPAESRAARGDLAGALREAAVAADGQDNEQLAAALHQVAAAAEALASVIK